MPRARILAVLAVILVLFAAAEPAEAAPQRRIRELAEQLETGSVEDRVRAADMLAKFGKRSSGAAPALAKATRSDEVELREAALEALIQIGPKGLDALFDSIELTAKAEPYDRMFDAILAFGDDGRERLWAWSGSVDASKLGIARLRQRCGLAAVASAVGRKRSREWLIEQLTEEGAERDFDRIAAQRELDTIADEEVRSVLDRAWFGRSAEDVPALTEALANWDGKSPSRVLVDIAEAGPRVAAIAPHLLERAQDRENELRRAYFWVLASLGHNGHHVGFAGVNYDPDKLLAIGNGAPVRIKDHPTPKEMVAVLGEHSREALIGMRGAGGLRNLRPRAAKGSRPVLTLHEAAETLWLAAPTWHELVVQRDDLLRPERVYQRIFPAFYEGRDVWTSPLHPSVEAAVPAIRAMAEDESDPERVSAIRVLLQWGVEDDAVFRHAMENMASVDYAMPDCSLAYIWRYRDRLPEYEPFLLGKIEMGKASDEVLMFLASLDSPKAHRAAAQVIVERERTSEQSVRVLLSLDDGLLDSAAPWFEARFLEGDYLTAPLLVRRGATSLPTLEKALNARLVDHRMIAVATLRTLGATSEPLVERLEEMANGESESRARAFVEEAVEAIKSPGEN